MRLIKTWFRRIGLRVPIVILSIIILVVLFVSNAATISSFWSQYSQACATLLTATAAVLSAGLVYASNASNRKTDQARSFNERYAAAATQLGAGSSASRLGAVFSIESLATDWAVAGDKKNHEQIQACIELLQAYLTSPQNVINEQPRQLDLFGGTRQLSRELDEQDLLVRRSILSVIAKKMLETAPWPHWRNYDSSLRLCALDQIELFGIHLEGMNFSGSTFRESLLHQTHFNNTHLYTTSFQDTYINKSSFHRANISQSNFTRAHISDSVGYYVNFSRTSLRDTFLTSDDFSESNFSDSDFTNANINTSTLIDCDCTYANFTGATITASTLRNTDFGEAIFTDAKIINCDFEKASFYHRSFDSKYSIANYFAGADLSGSNFSAATFESCPPDEVAKIKAWLKKQGAKV